MNSQDSPTSLRAELLNAIRQVVTDGNADTVFAEGIRGLEEAWNATLPLDKDARDLQTYAPLLEMLPAVLCGAIMGHGIARLQQQAAIAAQSRSKKKGLIV